MSFRDLIKVYGLSLLVMFALVVVFWRFVEPAPPDRVVMATGSEGGFYDSLGQLFKRELERSGIEVELVSSAGSVENLQLLQEGRADVALVQGGLANPQDQPGLAALASLAIEPLWMFSTEPGVNGLDELAGKRVAAGPTGSGTRALVDMLLERLALDEEIELVPIGGNEAAEALLAGEVDAALFVTTLKSKAANFLLRSEGVELGNTRRAPALSRNTAYLSVVEIPVGTFDLARDLPKRPLTLIGVATNLVARHDLHPALAGLLLRAASEAIENDRRLLGDRDDFPNARYAELPLLPEAERYFERGGPSFLQRYLPFWAANLVDRLWVLAIPLLTLAFPLFRIGPPVYQWQMSRKVWRWYKNLRDLEDRADAASARDDHEEVSAALKDLHNLQAEVGTVRVPLAYAERLYHLRQHARFVEKRLRAMLDPDARAPSPAPKALTLQEALRARTAL